MAPWEANTLSMWWKMSDAEKIAIWPPYEQQVQMRYPLARYPLALTAPSKQETLELPGKKRKKKRKK